MDSIAQAPRDLDSEFETAVAAVIEEETGGDPNGGLTDDPNDPGGVTKWGISQRAHPQLDVNNLSRTDAEGVYKAEYWTPLLPYGLSTELLRLAFECSINEGFSKTKEFLAGAKGLVAWFQAERAMAYVANPKFNLYGRGWLRRLFQEMETPK
jgi:lysozyme family protein